MTQQEQPGGQLAKRDRDVEHRPAGDVAGPVLDAELVDDRDAAAAPRKRVELTVLGKRPGDLGAAVGHRAAAAPQDAGRVVWVAATGVVSWARRGASAATHGHLRAQVRRAIAAGDQEQLATWNKILQEAKDARQARWLRAPKVAVATLAVAGTLLGVAVVLVFLLGVAAWLIPGGDGWYSWWDGVGGAIAATSTIVQWLAGLAAAASLPLLGVLAWREGRRVAEPPRWLLSVEQRQQIDAEITPSKVVVALRDLGLPKLREAIKAMEDGGAGMLSPITVAGCGVEVAVRLPSGVATDEIQKRHKKLAENLDRHEHELHISIQKQARTVGLWIADSGALDEPVGPSPLVLDDAPAADIYTGRAPWGINLRGDPVLMLLLQCHLLITGLSNQGKTAAARALVLWLIFDITVELRIADLKGIGDWHMFKELATTLIEGPADEHVIAGTEMLEAGVEEMERRLQALDKEKYPNGVTRQLARQKGSGFHTIILVIDEGQVAFMCPAVDAQGRQYGGTKATSRFFNAARKILNQGRAVNVLLYLFTQNPTDQNLPKLIREGFHIRASLVLGTVEQSRMALGDKAVNGGAAPHLLRQGIDKGVLVVAGDGVPLPPGQSSITVRTNFINGEGATGLAGKAVELRKRRGRHLALAPAAEQVDHLANVAQALGDEPRLRTPVLLGELIAIDEDTYTPWSFQDLKRELAHVGVPVKIYNGDSVVRRSDVLAALDARLDEPS